MNWRLLMTDGEGHKYTSSVMRTRDDALAFACDLLRDGELRLIKIENDRGEVIDLDEVTLWAEAAKLGRTERGRA